MTGVQTCALPIYPDDPARLIAWLATDEASWITGQVINTEGGFRRWDR